MGQLYYRDLYKEFFERYPTDATDFYAVSGYVGPDPVNKLLQMPFRSYLIYGLQRETQNVLLHNQLIKTHGDRVSIFYPDIPSHAKCYLWMKGDKPVRGLIGSANFSTNGLYNDFREILMGVEPPDLYAIKAYFELIRDSSKECDQANVVSSPKNTVASPSQECELELYDDSGQVQPKSGLNWGFADAHVAPNDALIAIRKAHLRSHPSFFQPIFFNPEDGHRSRKSKEAIELIWDDGVIMEALFEGSQIGDDGLTYPKNLSSTPKKSILGEYIRARLGLSPVTRDKNPKDRITREMLVKYGASSIKLKLIQPGVYSADFSPR
jgi:hypothetical protein